MVTSLQTFTASLPVSGGLGKNQLIDPETGQPIFFGEILKIKEKQLQQEQFVNAATITAALMTLQTQTVVLPVPIFDMDQQAETIRSMAPQTDQTHIPLPLELQSDTSIMADGSLPVAGTADKLILPDKLPDATAQRLTSTDQPVSVSQASSNIPTSTSSTDTTGNPRDDIETLPGKKSAPQVFPKQIVRNAQQVQVVTTSFEEPVAITTYVESNAEMTEKSTPEKAAHQNVVSADKVKDVFKPQAEMPDVEIPSAARPLSQPVENNSVSQAAKAMTSKPVVVDTANVEGETDKAQKSSKSQSAQPGEATVSYSANQPVMDQDAVSPTFERPNDAANSYEPATAAPEIHAIQDPSIPIEMGKSLNSIVSDEANKTVVPDREPSHTKISLESSAQSVSVRKGVENVGGQNVQQSSPLGATTEEPSSTAKAMDLASHVTAADLMIETNPPIEKVLVDAFAQTMEDPEISLPNADKEPIRATAPQETFVNVQTHSEDVSISRPGDDQNSQVSGLQNSTPSSQIPVTQVAEGMPDVADGHDFNKGASVEYGKPSQSMTEQGNSTAEAQSSIAWVDGSVDISPREKLEVAAYVNEGESLELGVDKLTSTVYVDPADEVSVVAKNVSDFEQTVDLKPTTEPVADLGVSDTKKVAENFPDQTSEFVPITNDHLDTPVHPSTNAVHNDLIAHSVQSTVNEDTVSSKQPVDAFAQVVTNSEPRLVNADDAGQPDIEISEVGAESVPVNVNSLDLTDDQDVRFDVDDLSVGDESQPLTSANITEDADSLPKSTEQHLETIENDAPSEKIEFKEDVAKVLDDKLVFSVNATKVQSAVDADGTTVSVKLGEVEQVAFHAQSQPESMGPLHTLTPSKLTVEQQTEEPVFSMTGDSDEMITGAEQPEFRVTTKQVSTTTMGLDFEQSVNQVSKPKLDLTNKTKQTIGYETYATVLEKSDDTIAATGVPDNENTSETKGPKAYQPKDPAITYVQSEPEEPFAVPMMDSHHVANEPPATILSQANTVEDSQETRDLVSHFSVDGKNVVEPEINADQKVIEERVGSQTVSATEIFGEQLSDEGRSVQQTIEMQQVAPETVNMDSVSDETKQVASQTVVQANNIEATPLQFDAEPQTVVSEGENIGGEVNDLNHFVPDVSEETVFSESKPHKPIDVSVHDTPSMHETEYIADSQFGKLILPAKQLDKNGEVEKIDWENVTSKQVDDLAEFVNMGATTSTDQPASDRSEQTTVDEMVKAGKTTETVISPIEKPKNTQVDETSEKESTGAVKAAVDPIAQKTNFAYSQEITNKINQENTIYLNRKTDAKASSPIKDTMHTEEPMPQVNQMPKAMDATPSLVKEATDIGSGEQAGKVNAQTAEIFRQVIQQMNVKIKSGPSSMHLQLNPKELGAIDVEMVSSSQGMHVTFYAEQASTGKLLETGMMQLRDSLMETGVQLAGLNISQHNQFNQKGGGFTQGQNFIHNPEHEFTQGKTSKEETVHVERVIGQTGEVDYRI